MATNGTHLASSNYLETAASNWFQPGRTITVMFWARPGSLPPNGNYWSVVGTTHSAGTSGWAISLQGGVSTAFWEMFFTNNGTNYDDFRFTTAAVANRWDHVTYVMRSAATEAGYLNGRLETLVQASNAGTYPATASRALRIRYGDSTGNGTFDGGLAYLRIFDGELSQPEIQAEMLSRRVVNKRLHVICDYPMEKLHASSVVVPDLGPQGLHVTTITGTVTWFIDPTLPALPRRLPVLNVAAGGQTIAVNQATETDTAQPLTVRKTRTVNQISETDTSQAIAEVKTKTVNQVTEANTAQPITEVKARTVVQNNETDTAQPITAHKTKAINQITETDTAQTVNEVKSRTVNQTTETDTAQPMTHRKTKIIGQNTETDTAQGITPSGATIVNQATETELAQPITVRKTKTLGITVETDLAQLVTRIKIRTIQQVTETELAQLIHVANIRLIQQVSETDVAQPIAHPVTVTNPDTIIRSSQELTVLQFAGGTSTVRFGASNTVIKV